MVATRGRIIIDAATVRPGMIQLGRHMVSIYPDTGIIWDQHGGEVVFHGECNIGSGAAVSFGRNTHVEFGHHFVASAQWRCVSYRGIEFGENTRFGWNNLVMDTNLHRLYDRDKKAFKKASGRIVIGAHNWFATDCRVLHSTVTPPRCIFAAGTTVTPRTPMESYCVSGGSPARILTRNVERIYGQDSDGE